MYQFKQEIFEQFKETSVRVPETLFVSMNPDNKPFEVMHRDGDGNVLSIRLHGGLEMTAGVGEDLEDYWALWLHHTFLHSTDIIKNDDNDEIEAGEPEVKENNFYIIRIRKDSLPFAIGPMDEEQARDRCVRLKKSEQDSTVQLVKIVAEANVTVELK